MAKELFAGQKNNRYKIVISKAAISRKNLAPLLKEHRKTLVISDDGVPVNILNKVVAVCKPSPWNPYRTSMPTIRTCLYGSKSSAWGSSQSNISAVFGSHLVKSLAHTALLAPVKRASNTCSASVGWWTFFPSCPSICARFSPI